MRGRVKIYENEGRTRDERESCFPSGKINQTKGVGTR